MKDYRKLSTIIYFKPQTSLQEYQNPRLTFCFTYYDITNNY